MEQLTKFLPFALLLLIACSGNQEQKPEMIDEGSETANKEHISQVSTLFYNLPSPVEMANLTKGSGIVYSKELLNSTQNVDKYNTTSSLALNLGVYGADLSYSRIYDQIQESVNYLSVIRKITEVLKIPQEEGSMALNRLEQNLNNRDTLMKLIIDIYSDADFYLKENDRGATAVLIIVGGWIEAIYIATHIVNPEKPDKKLMDRIAEQKYSIESLIKLLEMYPENKEIKDKLMPSLNEIKQQFDQIEIINKSGAIKTDSIRKNTVIGNVSEIHVNIDNILGLKKSVSKLRNEIIK